MTRPIPVLKAMLLCSEIAQDDKTGKVSLLGIFDNINARTFPYVVKTLPVYAKIADAQGEYEFNLKLVDPNGKTIIDATMVAPIDDRVGSNELIFNFDNFFFKDPGTYEFRRSADGRLIGLHLCNVLDATK